MLAIQLGGCREQVWVISFKRVIQMCIKISVQYLFLKVTLELCKANA